MDHGLPSELSPLLELRSLTTMHLYNPYSSLDFRGADFPQYVWKLTWIRKLGEEFALDSAWIRVERQLKSNIVPEPVSQLLKRVPNLTLEASFQYAAAVALPIWSSLHSLTILTDDFPTSFLRHVPSSLDLLIFRFKAHCCRSTPSYLDNMVLGVLTSRTTKKVRVCISTMR